jgi:hypothetical protein
VPDDADVPLPPSDLAARVLPILETPGPWIRIHRVEQGPIFFGRTLMGRFDDPQHEYGVLYVADTLAGAFIETFGRNPGLNTVAERRLRARAIARVQTARVLRLVDLTGSGLARLGATSALFAGPHAAARTWARAPWSHAAAPDGLLYRSRHDPSCLIAAICDRAAQVVEAKPLGNVLAPENREGLRAILGRYDFSIQP